jgi:hypothetical protein
MSLGNIEIKVLNRHTPFCKIKVGGKNRKKYKRGIAVCSQTNCILCIKQTNWFGSDSQNTYWRNGTFYSKSQNEEYFGCPGIDVSRIFIGVFKN